jgi:signal transduction histidine kinase
VPTTNPDHVVVDLRLPSAPEAVDQSRAALAKVRGLRPAVEDRLALLVTEVVGEAVRNAVTADDGLTLRVVVNHVVRVDVRDAGAGFDPGAAGGGFGFKLLDHLADRWGAEPGSLWFELQK